MVHPLVRIWLPYVNLTIATSALCFQVGVLYPWHEELDTAFHKMKEEQARQLRDYHELKVKRIEQLEQRVLGVEKWEVSHRYCSPDP